MVLILLWQLQIRRPGMGNLFIITGRINSEKSLAARKNWSILS